MVNFPGGAFGFAPKTVPPGFENKPDVWTVVGWLFNVNGPCPFIDLNACTVFSTSLRDPAEEISKLKLAFTASVGRNATGVVENNFAGGGSAQKATPAIDNTAMAQRSSIPSSIPL